MRPAGCVTALDAARLSPAVVDVYVEGDFWRCLNKRVANRAGLHVGTAITTSVLETIQLQERSVAEDLSLRLLSYRARSVAEIRKRLTASGLAPEAVESQVASLERAGYLDDVLFARAWIDERVRTKKYGRRRIESELLGKGVGRETFGPELDAVCSEAEEEQRAVSLLESKEGSSLSASGVAERRRLHELLVRRGFSASAASRALRYTQDDVSTF